MIDQDKVVYIGYTCKAYEDAADHIIEPSAPVHYKDKEKIEKYVKLAKERVMAEAAFNPLTGYVDYMTYTSCDPKEAQKLNMALQEDQERAFDVIRNKSYVVAFQPKLLLSLLRANLALSRFLNPERNLLFTSVDEKFLLDPINELIPDAEFEDYPHIAGRFKVPVDQDWLTNSDSNVKLVQRMAEIIGFRVCNK